MAFLKGSLSLLDPGVFGSLLCPNCKRNQADRICIFVQHRHPITCCGTVAHSLWLFVPPQIDSSYYKYEISTVLCIRPKYGTRRNNNSISTKNKGIVRELWDWPSFWGCGWINKTWLGADVVPQNWLEGHKRTKSLFISFSVLAKDLLTQYTLNVNRNSSFSSFKCIHQIFPLYRLAALGNIYFPAWIPKVLFALMWYDNGFKYATLKFKSNNNLKDDNKEIYDLFIFIFVEPW